MIIMIIYELPAHTHTLSLTLSLSHSLITQFFFFGRSLWEGGFGAGWAGQDSDLTCFYAPSIHEKELVGWWFLQNKCA